MPHLTPIHYGKFCKFLEYIGCEFKRKKGSHLIYTRHDLSRPIVIPEHKHLSLIVITGNLKTLGISKEKYLKLLEKIH